MSTRERTPHRPATPLGGLVRVALARSPEMLMTEEQCLLIGSAVRLFPACRLLVFGAGHDSQLWHDINEGGTTVFLEHDDRWRRETLSRAPGLDMLPVEYSTSILQWRELLDRPESLRLDLPPRIRDARWDVILVDAPNGFKLVAHHPAVGAMHGRMQSILAARELVAEGGFVIVDDTDREVEATYADRYLGPRNRVFSWRARRREGHVVEMRCYRAPGPDLEGRLRALRLRWMAGWMKLSGRWGSRGAIRRSLLWPFLAIGKIAGADRSRSP